MTEGVLCSGDVARRVADRVDVVPDEVVRLRGLGQPLHTHLAYRRRPRRSAHRRLFGRARETALLNHALLRLQHGRGVVVLLQGEAGLGKSALLADLAHAVATAGLPLLAGEGDAPERASSYHAWAHPLSALVVGSEATSPETLAGRLVERLEAHPGLAGQAALCNAVLPLELPETEATRHLSGQRLVDATLRFLPRLLDALLEGPCVLCFDEAHWLDSASRRLVEAVARTLEPVLVVLAIRPMARPPAELDALRAVPGFREVTLSQLGPADIERVLSRSLVDRKLGPRLRRLTVDRAAGDPFLAEQLAAVLRDSVRLVERDGGWGLRAAPEEDTLVGGAPVTPRRLITSRFDRLTSPEQLVLITGRGPAT